MEMPRTCYSAQLPPRERAPSPRLGALSNHGTHGRVDLNALSSKGLLNSTTQQVAAVGPAPAAPKRQRHLLGDGYITPMRSDRLRMRLRARVHGLRQHVGFKKTYPA